MAADPGNTNQGTNSSTDSNGTTHETNYWKDSDGNSNRESVDKHSDGSESNRHYTQTDGESKIHYSYDKGTWSGDVDEST